MIAAVTLSDVLAFSAVVGAAVSCATLFYGFMRDRQNKAKEERDSTRLQAETNADIIGRIHDDLNRLTETVLGRPAIDSYPATEGFMQNHDRRLASLEKLIEALVDES